MINTQNDAKQNSKHSIKNFYWAPLDSAISGIENFCKKNNFKNILEIGPGNVHFPLATSFIGFNENVKNCINLDIDVEQFPFNDKSVDFTYSRHTLEDIQNPDFCMKEIIRVSKSGYIETPSPLIEITKGVDATSKSETYAGYIHHRYIIWSDIFNKVIYFLPKYSSIIDAYIENIKERPDLFKLLENPFYWNNYFLWENGVTPKVVMYKNGINFNIQKNSNIIDDYINLITEGINTSISNTNYFINTFL